MQAENKKSAITEVVIPVLSGISIIAFLFTLIMCGLVAATYIRVTVQDPIASPALASLDQKLRDNPADQELREQIRALDYLSRKAFFTNREQVKTGGILIFIGVAVMAVSFLLRGLLLRNEPSSPAAKPRENLFLSNLVSRKSVMVAGGVLVAAGIALFVISIAGDFGFAGAGGAGAAGAGNLQSLQQAQDWEQASGSSVSSSGDTENGNGITETNAPGADLISAYGAVFGREYFNSWPAFRGPLGRGIAGSDADPPVEWDGATGKNLAWKSIVPKPGFSSPVVVGNKVLVSGATRKDAGIYCYDALTGKLLWSHEMPLLGSGVEAEAQTGFAAPTIAAAMPAAGNKGAAAALFANGDLVVCNLEGEMLWAENLGTPQINYGFASSPVIWGTTVIVQYDQKSGPRLLAKKISDGSTVWEQNRNVLSSWASPAFGLRNGKPALVTASNPLVSLYDPATGERLWSTDVLTGEIGSSPTYDDGLYFEGNNSATFGAFDEKTGALVWEYWDDLPEVASPLAAKGLVIMASSGGVVTCLRAKTGEVAWKQDFTDGFYSSPVLAKDRVYLIDREGICRVFPLSRDFSLVATNPTGEPVSATPAIAGNRIFIRGNRSLFCFGR